MSVATLFYRLRLKPQLGSLTRGDAQRRRQHALRLLSPAVVFVALLSLCIWLLGRVPEILLGGTLGFKLLAAAFSLFVLGSAVLGVVSALNILYFSSNLDALRALPLKDRTIFSYKFWEIMLSSTLPFAVVVLPILVAYGVASGVSPLYYPALILVSVLLLMIPTGVSVLLVMPVARVVPPGRAREFVVALAALSGVGVWAATTVLSRATPTLAHAPADVLRALAEAPALGVPPGTWASQALGGAARAEWISLLGGVAPLLATSLGVYAFCVWLSGWAYATGRARVTESGGRVRRSGWIRKLLGLLPRDVAAVAAKDLVSLPRDPRRLVVAAIPVVTGVGVALSSSVGQSPGEPGPYLNIAIWTMTFSVMSSVQAVGSEGPGYGVFAISPLSRRRLLAGKWVSVVCVGTAAVLLGCAGVALFHGFDWRWFLMGSVIGTVGVSLVSLFAVGVSAMSARFDLDLAAPFWSALAAVGCAFGVLAVAGVAIGIVVLANLLAPFAVPLWALAILALALWTAGALIPGYLTLSAGARRLERLEWNY